MSGLATVTDAPVSPIQPWAFRLWSLRSLKTLGVRRGWGRRRSHLPNGYRSFFGPHHLLSPHLVCVPSVDQLFSPGLVCFPSWSAVVIVSLRAVLSKVAAKQVVGPFSFGWCMVAPPDCPGSRSLEAGECSGCYIGSLQLESLSEGIAKCPHASHVAAVSCLDPLSRGRMHGLLPYGCSVRVVQQGCDRPTARWKWQAPAGTHKRAGS
jgi:hypothetical protein